MMKKHLKTYLISIAVALAVGGLSSLAAGGFSGTFDSLTKPPLSPPAIVFPIVWSVLFVLMGISAAMVFRSGEAGRFNALLLYGIQLFVNFFWPVLFFRLEMYTAAFFWLILLILLVLATFISFYKIRPAAGLLLLPYLAWLLFAAYLNLGIAILN